ENKQLYFTLTATKYKYICDFDNDCVKAVCDRFHLLGHMDRNALRETVNKEYIGISTNSIYNYVRACFSCQRVSVPSPTLSLTHIIPDFIRDRLIVDTIDVSEYAESNMNKKYIFKMIDSLSKFVWCYPVERKCSSAFLEAIKDLYYTEGSWQIFHSDNGDEFTAIQVQNFIRNVMRATIVYGAPYRPQTQVQIERFNRT
ncbi:Gag-Pol polyprotein, partial [Cucumispora dikerogammari]